MSDDDTRPADERDESGGSGSPAEGKPTLSWLHEDAAEPGPPEEGVRQASAAEGVEDRQFTDEPAVRRPAGEHPAQDEGSDAYEEVVRNVARHVRNDYDLIGLAGYSGSGKTHYLRALSLLLRQHHFEVADVDERLTKARAPVPDEARVYQHPASHPGGSKFVFVDAGGELYVRIRLNDWDLGGHSRALLHSLYHCRGLFLLLHLQPGHFRLGSMGTYRGMSEDEQQLDEEARRAQEELNLFDHFLLFLRALKAEEGDEGKLVRLCAAAPDIDTALRHYREEAPLLDLPVQVLMSKADSLADATFEVGTGISVAPRRLEGVAPFVARYLPSLFASLLTHVRRFRFDFVQSYEEKDTGLDEPLTMWEADDDEYLSCGAMPAFEFLVKNRPERGWLGNLLRRFELETRTAIRLDRILHRKRWKGVEIDL